jgi:RHS repeat-associated protein
VAALGNATATWFEHLDDWQLIHMNGRVFDYNLGRFMSIDPIIQSPGNSQSINGYSYIMNNPLSGTDPSGLTVPPLFEPSGIWNILVI